MMRARCTPAPFRRPHDDASYDAIVISSGQAGPFLAVRLAQAGKRTALIEREHLGGTCVNDGRIPTKTLVASARTVQVTVVEYGDRLIAREDREVSREVQAILEREGIAFHFSVKSAKVATADGGQGVRLAIDAGETTHDLLGSHLLAAVGRKPNTDDLGLDRARIATDARGFAEVRARGKLALVGVMPMTRVAAPRSAARRRAS